MGTGKLENIFVIDLVKPPGGATTDDAYPVLKSMFAKKGILSQFVNFNTFDHSKPPRDEKDEKRSLIILQAIARQILQKCGAFIWWARIPRENSHDLV